MGFFSEEYGGDTWKVEDIRFVRAFFRIPPSESDEEAAARLNKEARISWEEAASWRKALNEAYEVAKQKVKQ